MWRKRSFQLLSYWGKIRSSMFFLLLIYLYIYIYIYIYIYFQKSLFFYISKPLYNKKINLYIYIYIILGEECDGWGKIIKCPCTKC